jgi:hypothetical protein
VGRSQWHALILTLVFVAGGIWIVLDPGMDRPSTPPAEARFVGFATIAFFGIGAIVLLWRLFRARVEGNGTAATSLDPLSRTPDQNETGKI